MSLAMAMVLIYSAVGASAESTSYTVTSNLYVPAANNEILGVNAYLTNSFVLPTSPVSNNATITDNGDGTYTLSVPIANNTFALIDLGTPQANSGISNIVETRNTSTYGSNTNGRITNLTMTIEEGTASVSFTGSHEYSGYFLSPGDKYFNLKLDVDWTNVP
ncbi:hypothetical protein [Cohnella fermenti]|uniref:DUF4402 domain-containing protein n=1 Tax=Cohnella fermenti TaxID=2565925 RepID=A0A4S4C625_9BACL|nr:hypothetical protein [Cohnella fermenti]THF83311.1 hypothetical protein E6C55_05525 [Cohnella fermenti]